jgi:PAS domain S-box-containing protein
MRFEELTAKSKGSPLIAAGLDGAELLEKVPLAIYVCDSDGHLVYCNSRAVELWGHTPVVDDDSERYWGSCKLCFNGLQVPREEAPMASVLRTGVPVRGAQAKIERPDGSCIWTRVNIEPLEDDAGHVVGAINCFQRMATSVVNDEDRLAATFEQAGIGLIETDDKGKLLRANAYLCELLGVSQEELLGQSVFDLTHPEDVPVDRAQYARQVAGEIDGYSLKKRFRRRDGEHFWAAVTSRSVRDPQGRFLYAVRVQQDITEQLRGQEALARHIEEQAVLQQLNANLQHATSLDAVYRFAIDAIMRILRCQRAAILLFDAIGQMRFVYWRGLSDAYRTAVEGHSPWTAETKDPEPVFYEDVAASGLPQSLKHTVLKEGIAALAFLPLLGRRPTVGQVHGLLRCSAPFR